MEFGLALPQSEGVDLSRDVVMIAREAELAGFASLWVYERALFPLNPSDGMYGVPGLAWIDAYRSTADPLTVLAVAAAVTERVRLGTCVLVAGLHSTLHIARAMATLDQVTGGGRIVAGLGSGWSSDESRAVGADFRARGQALDETIQALRALWGPDPVTYRDSRMAVENALVSPKPSGRIPVLLGGGVTRVAMERIARVADGWLPTGIPVSMMAQRLREIRKLAVTFGRRADDVRMVPLVHVSVSDQPSGADRAPFQGSVAQIVEDVAEVAQAGAHEVILAQPGFTSGKEFLNRSMDLLDGLRDAGLAS